MRRSMMYDDMKFIRNSTSAYTIILTTSMMYYTPAYTRKMSKAVVECKKCYDKIRARKHGINLNERELNIVPHTKKNRRKGVMR